MQIYQIGRIDQKILSFPIKTLASGLTEEACKEIVANSEPTGRKRRKKIDKL